MTFEEDCRLLEEDIRLLRSAYKLLTQRLEDLRESCLHPTDRFERYTKDRASGYFSGAEKTIALGKCQRCGREIYKSFDDRSAWVQPRYPSGNVLCGE